MRYFIISLLSVLLVSCGGIKRSVNSEGGLAIKGYDAVSYLDKAKAEEGVSKFSRVYKEFEYRFVNEDHLKAFESDPEKYIPAYGGYCAWALAEGGGKVDINPESYKVIGGKTYLFYDHFIGGNTLEKWNSKLDDEGQVESADKRWRELGG